MIKHCFVGFLNGAPEIDGARWYFRYHAPEAVRFVGPWLRRYETYRAYEPPPDAARLGAVGGRMTELWYSSTADFIEADPAGRPYTMEPWLAELPPRGFMAGIAVVPARPTEDFLGKEPTPEERPILRWYRLLKYPDGVSRDEGEEWYLNVHSQEVMQQPGLLHYVSHRAMDNCPIKTPWLRVEEQWYEDIDAWHKAVVDNPPKFTAPVWSKQAPFLDSVSNFLPYKPEIDYLKDHPFIP